jgi:hypothetical protein
MCDKPKEFEMFSRIQLALFMSAMLAVMSAAFGLPGGAEPDHRIGGTVADREGRPAPGVLITATPA